MHRLVFLACIVACADSPTAPKRPTTTTAADQPLRRITARDQLPKPIQPLLPEHGLYAAGGGLVSSSWRIVVDRDAKTIYAGTAQGPNAASFGKMDKESKKDLSPRNDEHLMALAEAAWREGISTEQTRNTADYGEILIVVDGGDAFYLESRGAIDQPAAAKVIEELRAAAGL